MELLSIEMKNFRQFYGEQSVDFSKGDKNVTIIFGENGKGKTGIFRALMFGLYGSTYLPQDNKRDKIHLVNFHAINESSPAIAKVRIVFRDKGQKYIIIRTIKAVKLNNKIHEKEVGVKLYNINNAGDFLPTPMTDKEEIDRKISSILDEKIKDFFLFDAEKIDTLAKTDSKVKQEVKTGLVKLLQIDKLEKAISITNRLLNKESRRIVDKSSSIDLKSKEESIQDIVKVIYNLEDKLDIKKENIISCSNEIKDINKKLEENEDIRIIHEKIKDIQKDKNFTVESLNLLREGLVKHNFDMGHKIIMEDFYELTLTYLNQISVDQKDLVSLNIIEKSLKEKICACCKNNLIKDEEALNHVKYLKNNYRPSEFTPLISNMNSSIHDFKVSKEENNNSIKESLIQIREHKDKIGFYDKTIESLKEKSKNFSQSKKNLTALENSINKKEKYLENLKYEVMDLERSIKEKYKEKEKLEREYEILLRKNAETRHDVKRLDYIKKLKESLDNVFTEYSDDMREKLMEESTIIFKALIDPKDKQLINKIVINSKYEIEIYGWNNMTITQDISQGQRQVVALSFITALAKVAAGGNKNINFPLFMDSPFGRISGKNRDNLIDNIPELTSQWILLLTDTEFSVSEENRFKVNNKLGNWYRLEQIKTGYSKIVEFDLSENIATRR